MIKGGKYERNNEHTHKWGGNVNYSTDERIIGTWIDGSTLYEKTVNCGALPNNTNKQIAHGISNISKIVSISGYAWKPSSNSVLPLPSVSSEVGLDANTSNIVTRTNLDLSAYTESYVTLQYTK